MIFKEGSKIDKTTMEFVEKRKTGAKKIAEEASAKGETAKLTAFHFKKKVQCYDEALRMLKAGSGAEDFEKKFKAATIKALHHVGQKKFQEDLGEAEVYGEIMIYIKKGDTE